MRVALEPLRHKMFAYLAAGRFITMLGNAIAPIALAFAVLDLTGSVTDLGLVVAARSLVNVVFLLFGGVVADRLPRNLVMVGSSVLAAITQAITATLILSGSATVGILAGLAALNGAVAAFAFPASLAVTAQTVPQTLLQPANAINRLAMNSAMIGGALLGGVLVAAVGPGWGLALDAATFALGALAFSRVRVGGVSTQKSHPFTDLREGWREFIAHRWLWTVVLGFTFLNMTYAAAFSVLGPAIADGSVGRTGWGVVLAAETLGMVAGALLALSFKVRRMLLVGVAVLLVEMPLLIALASSPRLLLLVPLAVLAGVGFEVFGIAWETTMQTHIPADRLARVYSYDALGSFLAIPIGQMAAGPAAERFGAGNTLLAGVALSTLVILILLALPAIRKLRNPIAEPEPEPATEPIAA